MNFIISSIIYFEGFHCAVLIRLQLKNSCLSHVGFLFYSKPTISHFCQMLTSFLCECRNCVAFDRTITVLMLLDSAYLHSRLLIFCMILFNQIYFLNFRFVIQSIVIVHNVVEFLIVSNLTTFDDVWNAFMVIL